jgi:geranylgeranyl pyrophosphate synthase
MNVGASSPKREDNGQDIGLQWIASWNHPILDGTDEGKWARQQLARVASTKRIILDQAGSLHQPLSYISEVPGKFFRPLLLLGFCALSPQNHQPDQDVIAAAAAIESLHECSLLHDDIIDHSTIRRGRRSAAAAFNVRTAANAGCYLAGRAIATLAQACRSARVNPDLRMLRDLAKAQIIEALPPAANPAEHLTRICAIVNGKTGVLMRLAVEIGAGFTAMTGGPAVPEADLTSFSEALALAYQIRDDILDLELDERLRRPGNNDVRRGIPSWPMTLWVSSHQDPEAAWRKLREGVTDAVAAERLRRKILETDATKKAWATVNEQLDRSRKILISLPPSLGRGLLMKILDCL